MTNSPDKPSSRSWSKDYVEHLRSTHFALIAVSITLIALMAASRPYDPEAALDQLDHILDLKTKWNPNWLAKLATKVGFGGDRQQGEAVGIAFEDCLNQVLTITEKRSKLPRERFILKMEHGSKLVPLSDQSRPNLDSFPNTVSEFELVWNYLETPVALGEPLYLDRFATIGHSPPYLLECDISSIKSNALKELIFEKTFADSNSPRSQIAIQIKDKELRADLKINVIYWAKLNLSQDNFKKELKTFKIGKFDAAFPELAKAARVHGPQLEMEVIRKQLSGEILGGQEAFEFLGMKFPVKHLRIWGIVVLFAVQIYLLIYLRQRFGTRRLDDPGQDVPWIGIDGSSLGNIVHSFTTIALPIIATMLLCVQTVDWTHIRSLWNWIWLPILIIQFILSWLLFRFRPGLPIG